MSGSVKKRGALFGAALGVGATLALVVGLGVFAGAGGAASAAAPKTSATGQAQTTSAKRAKTVVISTRKLPKLGTVLVNSKGRTLYMFVPDKRKKVTCVGTCAAVWPPVKLPKGAKPVAAGKAKPSLLGSDPDPAGGRVVTYNGWPLYTYITDTAPGQANSWAWASRARVIRSRNPGVDGRAPDNRSTLPPARRSDDGGPSGPCS
jgi:predicted lipoprotein with Yx(FWY)xxD motif